jgi:hypothetical protein
VTAEARALRIEAKRVDGSVIERCGFTRGGPWDCDSAPPGDGAPLPGVTGAAAPVPSAPAPPPPAPPPNPSRSSFCACAAPGLSDSSGAWVGVGLAAVVLGAGRRVRRRS